MVQGLAHARPVDTDSLTGGPPLAWVMAIEPSSFHPKLRVSPLAFELNFIHEVGHLFGCDHSISQQSNGAEFVDGNYNYGYYPEGTSDLTIMAYRTETHFNQIPYFSSKDRAVDGVPLGDDHHDNRKQIMKMRFAVSQYGDESGTCNP